MLRRGQLQVGPGATLLRTAAPATTPPTTP
jgi:hypothetical protein